MSIHVEKLPARYAARVPGWYVSDWRARRVEVYRTKAQAVTRAREVWDGSRTHIVNVDWLPCSANTLTEVIGSESTIHDMR